MAFAVKIDKKDDVATLTPTNVRKAIAERSEKLHQVFDQAGADLDPSKVTVIEAADGQSLALQISAMNDELAWLGERATELDKIDSARAAADRWGAYGRGYDQDPANFAPKPGGPDPEERPKSFGQLFVASNAFKAARSRAGATSAVLPVSPMNFLRAFNTEFTTSAGFAPETTRTGRVVLSAQREIEVLDAIPMFPTTQAAIVYMEETTFTNNAAERSESGAYAEAALAFTEQSKTVRSIGVSLPVTDEQLADEAGIAAYLDQRLSFMVRQRLDGQCLAGNGTPPNILGTLNVGSINTQAKGGDNVPDAVYKGAKAVRVTGRAMPTVVFAHPNDWQDVRLLKTADGVYIWGSPSEAGPARIWGLPVVETTAVTENTMVVGDYQRHSGLHMRQDVEVAVGYVNDDFTDGRVTVRAGVRAALVHYRPAAFTAVTGV